MTIDWGGFAQVFFVSFAVALAVMVLVAVAIALLSPRAVAVRASAGPGTYPGPSDGTGGRPPGVLSRAAAYLCLLACAVIVGYGLYIIVS